MAAKGPACIAMALACATVVSSSPATPVSPLYDRGRARMFPVPTLDAWAAVQRVFSKNQIDARNSDEMNQLVTTIRMGVTPELFGFGPRDVDDAFATADVELHIFVSPFAEPARIYVGSIVRGQGPTTLIDGKPSARAMRKYQDDRIGLWVLDQVSAQLGVKGVEIPEDDAARNALAKSLMTWRTDRCLDRVPSRPEQRHFVQPSLLQRVEPIFPARSDVKEIAITITGRVQEDGFVSITDLRSLDLPPQFIAAARGAISLWTYRPAWGDQCRMAAGLDRKS